MIGAASLTPTQEAIINRALEFRRKIAARAVPDTGLDLKRRPSRVVEMPAPPVSSEPPIITDWMERQRKIWFSIEEVHPAIRRPTIKEVQKTVADFYGVTRIDLCSPRRDGQVMTPRLAAYLLSKELTLKSLPEIGRHFGGRDHTTLISGVRKARRLLEIDVQFSGAVASLRRIISERFS